MRLEHATSGEVTAVGKFQFHKGAIRTQHYHQLNFDLPDFNSIKVRLEHWVFGNSEPNINNFNSIKVRLELPLLLCCPQMLVFQFHKGAIRTICVMLREIFLANFNSIKVRLERS